jgi:hypothetical protein
VNQRLTTMKVLGEEEQIVAPNSMIELKDGQQILLSPEDGGRLVHVQLVKCS